jgi:Bacterial RNA polymerase, alpha chain C terminal domain
VTTRVSALRAKYRNTLFDERPGSVDEPSWDMFIAHVRDGRALSAIARETGLSRSKVSVIVARVGQDLDVPAPTGTDSHGITLDSPIEDLMLSMRARNALRELGCDSVRSVLEKDFTKAVRRLGAVSRQEILSALAGRGFAPPATLQDPRDVHVTELSRSVTRLKEHIDESYRRWCEQLERLELRVRRLSEN